MRIRIRARPATPPTTPPTTAGVDTVSPPPEPAPELWVDEGAEPVPLAPPKPPPPPATTPAVLEELSDEDGVLETDVCVCEALVLGKLDEEIELRELVDDDDEVVGEAPLVWEALSLVDVINVLFPLVKKVAWLKVLVPENEVVGTASKHWSAIL